MPKPTKRNAATLTHALCVALGALPFTSAEGEPLPTRIKIANWGENLMRGSKVKFLVNEETVKALAAQHQRGFDGIPGDYEHQSVPGHPKSKVDPIEYWARAGKVEAVQGDGLYYLPGEYTESGRKYAANYQDVSAVFNVDKKTNAVTAVRSVALCQHGQIHGAEFLQASLAIAAAMNAGAGGEDATALDQLLTYVRDLLEVSEDATLDDLATGLEGLVRQKNTPDPKDNPTAKPSKPMTDEEKAALAANTKLIGELAGTVTTLAASVNTLTASQQTAQHNAAVEQEFTVAASLGKVVPETLKKKDAAGKYVIGADTVKEVIAAIPQTVETQFSTPGSVVSASAAAANTQTTDQICASLGLSKEAWEKGSGLKPGNQPHGEIAKKIAAAA